MTKSTGVGRGRHGSCPPGCSCSRHYGNSGSFQAGEPTPHHCEEGCTCKRHHRPAEVGAKIAAAKAYPLGSSYVSDGRVFVKTEEGWDREHRVIMGRPVGLIVHHKDGNPSNNELENLEVMTRADHARIHHTKEVMPHV